MTTTAAGVPSPQRWFRRNRGWLLIGLGLVVSLALLALTNGVGTQGTLDPDSYEPTGGHALAALLRQQGVTVDRTTDVETTLADVGPGTTIFIPTPATLSPDELSELLDSDADIVLSVDPVTLDDLSGDAQVDGIVETKKREPGCGADAAIRSGTARMGGFTLTTKGSDDVQRCYDGTLLIDTTTHLTLLGTGDVLSNDQLGDEGDAELGLRLLGKGSTVHWLIPDPNRKVVGTIKPTSLTDLLPGWVPYVVLQLFVALLGLALWRGRRLGRVVPEPLPVVVRAAETVEGRGRLYRAAGSRATAAEALRSGTRDRLSRRLGTGRNPQPEVLVDVVARRASRSLTDVHVLLYGPPPVDDSALVALARDLDSLTRSATSSQEVAGS